ncbi:MAG: hypothetical protein EZS28_019389 [Streblomastix strix]|uniref:Uncharacterized protein n=1 Tax=Streblomastix strix TaxID=222440 RepID=A0A5J4VRB3_9EUKA|nr:MAG: hypothetical protein EZS28_019389 [Streblomastix strix]
MIEQIIQDIEQEQDPEILKDAVKYYIYQIFRKEDKLVKDNMFVTLKAIWRLKPEDELREREEMKIGGIQFWEEYSNTKNKIDQLLGDITEGVNRMNITTFQKIATRSNRPNDPITRIRKGTKQVVGPPPELPQQQTRISGVIVPEEVKDPINTDQEKQLLSIQNFDALVEVKLIAQFLQ